MESGLAEGALVSPHMIMTSAEMRRTRSMGHGWVVKVDEEETYESCEDMWCVCGGEELPDDSCVISK